MIWYDCYTVVLQLIWLLLQKRYAEKKRLLGPLPGFSSSGHFKMVTKRHWKSKRNLKTVSVPAPRTLHKLQVPPNRGVKNKHWIWLWPNPTSFDELSLDIKMSWSGSSCSIRIRSYELCSIHPFPGHGDFGFCITAYENSIWITSRNQDFKKWENQINKTHRCDIALPS